MRTRWSAAGTCTAVLVVLLAAACSSSGSSGNSASNASSSSNGLVKVKMELSPVVDGEPVFYAVSNGIFKKHGLDVDAFQAPVGGPAAIPNLLNGQIQFEGTGPGTVIPVWAQGIPVTAVAPLSFSGSNASNTLERLIATKASGITSVSQLAGKTIAVPTLNNMGQTVISAYLAANGVDPSSVKYTAVPYPSMEAAIKSGAATIEWCTEPYLTEIQHTVPINILGAPEPTVGSFLPNFMVVASNSYVSSHKQVIQEMQAAIAESITDLGANPAEARSFTHSFTTIPTQYLQQMNMPNFSIDWNVNGFQQLADTALKYGIIKTSVDVSKHMLTFPPAS